MASSITVRVSLVISPTWPLAYNRLIVSVACVATPRTAAGSLPAVNRVALDITCADVGSGSNTLTFPRPDASVLLPTHDPPFHVAPTRYPVPLPIATIVCPLIVITLLSTEYSCTPLDKLSSWLFPSLITADTLTNAAWNSCTSCCCTLATAVNVAFALKVDGTPLRPRDNIGVTSRYSGTTAAALTLIWILPSPLPSPLLMLTTVVPALWPAT